jgi:dynein heavy chain 2
LSEEIMRLLPRADRQDLELDDLFHYFDAVPLYHVSEYSEPVWRTAVERFDEAMAPVEARTASSLRKRIAGLTDRPHLLIGELQNFANLLTRPNIRSDLGGEMSGFVSSLGGYISEAQKEFEKGKGDYTEDNAVKGVQWAVKLKLRASQAATVANTVLAEVQGVNRLQQSADDVKTNIDQFTKGLAKRWGQSIVSISQDDSEQNRAMLGTWTDLTMAADGKLGVKFSNRLSSTVRDAQALAQLGFELPAEAKELAADADKYYRHNLKLRQAANFYNTTLSTVLPAQFTMLQTDIQKVERIVKDQKGHGWDSPVQCQKYVQRFLATAEELATRNRQLRAVHAQLATGINDLMGTNLLNDREKWNTQLQELQAVIAREERTCDAKAIQIWKAHWEHQLFKAFEYQYRLCLESLTDNLFDIEVDLFFSRKRLNFRPPLEDMRTKYYRNLKKFLDLPKAFAGFIEGNEGENEFASIPERNAEGLLTVYANAEALFAQLKELVDKYEHWVALGTVDIEDYVDAHLADLKDYKKNFDMLEKKRNESLALPDEEKIGCFTVSFAPFKIALEDLMHKFSDALLLSLRKKAVGGLKQVRESHSYTRTIISKEKPVYHPSVYTQKHTHGQLCIRVGGGIPQQRHGGAQPSPLQRRRARQCQDLCQGVFGQEARHAATYQAGLRV